MTSGLILTLLLVTIVSFTGQVNAQAPPDMSQIPGAPTTVSGTYSNSDYGVQMTFPDGWQAMEMKVPGSTTSGDSVVATKAVDNSNAATNTATAITLSMNYYPPNTPYTSQVTPRDPTYKCDTLSSDNTNVNGMSGTVTIVHCTGPGDLDVKLKSYAFQTDKNAIIEVTYMGMPSSQYDSNLALFDSTVKTLQIANTVNAPSVSSNPTSDATVPEFPTMASLILAVSVFAIIGFTMISRKNNLFLFGRN